MTIKTFWTIFLKILGIWLVLDCMTVIPQFFSTLFFVDTKYSSEYFAWTLVLLLSTIGLYILILRLFVFRTAWLIDKLKLDKGFDEEKLDINIQHTTVLTIATIVIGGLMFIDNLPLLCRQTFAFFQQQNVFRESPSSEWISLYLVETVLGYLLMTKSKFVIAFIDRKIVRQNNSDE
jgi:hypothetical protein